MRAVRGKPAGACVALLCAAAVLVAAASASARTLHVKALARVAYVGTTSRGLELAGTVSDRALGKGGLLAALGATAGGYGGTATIVNPSGSLTATVRVATRSQGTLVNFGVTADVTAGTGRFAGARGTLTGTALVTATAAVGNLRLHGTLRGATGRAPAPVPNRGVRHVKGVFRGAELSLARGGLETLVGSAAGLVPGPAVVVVRDRATTTRARGTYTLFAAGGTLTGFLDVHIGGGSGALRAENGTVTVTGGTGAFRGAHTTSPGVVRGTRDLRSQQLVLRITGGLTP